MRPGLMMGAWHVVRYTVPAHQTVPDLLPALAEFRRGARCGGDAGSRLGLDGSHRFRSGGPERHQSDDRSGAGRR